MRGTIDEAIAAGEKMMAEWPEVAATFALSILTPEKTVFEGPVEYVQVPAPRATSACSRTTRRS